jgi:hypothetical protein
MTAYYTAVANDLLPAIRSGERMPAALHLKREIGPIVAPFSGQMTLVEFEDDEAPAELMYRTVTPTIQAHYDGNRLTHTTIVGRDVDSTEWRVAPL